jgi:hypothetical protein
MNKHIFRLFAVIAFTCITTFVDAQCSMCKAVVESGTADKDLRSVGEQLNTGILFLMAIPYLFILMIPVIIFRKKIALFFNEMRGMYRN